MAWELRAAWGAGWRVALTLDERCCIRRAEGTVTHVSATGAWVEVAGWRIPMDAVLAVHRPSRLGDSTHLRGAWGRSRWQPPQREELEVE